MEKRVDVRLPHHPVGASGRPLWIGGMKFTADEAEGIKPLRTRRNHNELCLQDDGIPRGQVQTRR